MSQEMTFAQALNEAKGVILQLSNRVKADAEKIRTQQQTIVAQSATITGQEEKIHGQDQQLSEQATQLAAMTGRIRELETAGIAADSMINRQGDKITSLETLLADLRRQMADRDARIDELARERDHLRAQLPTDEDAQALAQMTALLAKAGPVLDKVKKTGGPTMRLADDVHAEAA